MRETLKLLATFACYDSNADVREFKNYIRYFCNVNQPQLVEDTLSFFKFDPEDFNDSIDYINSDDKKYLIGEIYRQQIFNFIPNSPKIKFRSGSIAGRVHRYFLEFDVESELSGNCIKLTPENKYKIVNLVRDQVH